MRYVPAILGVILLSGCSTEDVDYSGRYEIRTGNDCLASATKSEPIIELEATVSGKDVLYTAKMPTVGVFGFPEVSLPSTKKPDENKLTFTFKNSTIKAGSTRSQQVEMVVELTKHADLKGHLWLESWKVNVNNGINNRYIDALQMITKDLSRNGSESIGKRGICLAKILQRE